MFAYIKGKLTYLEMNAAVIEAAGVGYMINISRNSSAMLARLKQEEKESAQLFTYLSVKEDGVDLFGFFTKEELSFFKLLITVSGVGPKAALSILSELTTAEFVAAVISEDKKAISAAQNVGPKTAARIILELKDKVSNISPEITVEAEPVIEIKAANKNKIRDVEDALSVLGYSRQEIAAHLKNIDIDRLDVDEIIKICLTSSLS